MVLASGQDASCTPPWGGAPGMSVWDRTPGQTQDTLERSYLSASPGTPQDPPSGAAGGGQGEKSLGLLRLLAHNPDLQKL